MSFNKDKEAICCMKKGNQNFLWKNLVAIVGNICKTIIENLKAAPQAEARNL